MKKNLVILGSIMMIAVGCASWHRDRSDENRMNEPAGAERSSSSSNSGSMRSRSTDTNRLDNSSGSGSSSQQQGSDIQNTQPQQQQ